MGKGSCAVCNQEASQQCAGCKLVYYCGRDHQRIHWKRGHKANCCCYKVVENPTLGRYVIATRDIKAGDVILKEPPLIFGPKMYCFPTCLGCHRTLKPSSPDDEVPLNYYKCSKCGWPLCAPRCEDSQYHRQECELMYKSGYFSTISFDGAVKAESAYCTILPLRCLLMDSSKLKTLLSLESHLETRMKSNLYQVLSKNLVGFVQTILGLTHFDEETIMKVAGVLDTNTFEVRRSDGKVKIRGLYPKVAMLSHDCKPNTKHTYEGNSYNIVISAATSIKKDEIITTTYTQTLWGTLARRKHLYETKCFTCVCSRCSDPREFDLYVGGILCSKCSSRVLSDDPLSEKADWKCELCLHKISAKQMDTGNNSLHQELEAAKLTGISGLEAFIDKYMLAETVLHSTNSHILQAKHALSQLYGNALQTLTDDQIDRQIQICEDLLEVADILEPGLTRFRGLLLYDLQAAKFLQIKKQFENDKISQNEAQEKMINVTIILNKAAEILETEPDLIYLLEDKVKELAEFCQ